MTVARLSIIIPALNEAGNLPGLLRQIGDQSLVRQAGGVEVRIADGGSRDGTLQLARELARTPVPGMVVHPMQTAAGRAVQMNAAARLATAPDLLFLHADSRLDDPDLLARAVAALAQRRQAVGHDRVAGHFRLRFVHRPPGLDRILRFHEAKSALNRPETTNGDQGFLLSRAYFNALGGFDETLPFLEDQRLAAAIRAGGLWFTLPGELATSARRFHQEGFARRMILSALIMASHAIGFREFFSRAPGVYRQPGHTRRLCMTPFFRLIGDLDREAGFAVARRRWLGVGRYVRRSAWQLFFLLDLIGPRAMGWRRHPFLAFHDRVFRPLTDFFPFDILAAAIAWLWFVATGLYFALSETCHE